MLILHNGSAQLSSIHQRKGRTGYYITVATPKSLKAKLGNSIRKKVGNTHKDRTKPFSATLEHSLRSKSNYFPICEPTPFLNSF